MFGFGREKQEAVDRIMKMLMPEPVVAMAKAGMDAPFETTDVDFVLVLIEEPDRDRFSIAASKAIEVADRHRAILIANAGGLLQMAVGPRLDSKSGEEAARELAAALANAIGAVSKIMYGRATSHVGTVGVPERKTWGFFPVAITPILIALAEAKIGKPVAWEPGK